ncbi:MAG: TetR family transcriptional regulator [Acidimicrobiia bacterium]|nr:TetR family transcriptional regulator [Acidimicrobiia bacterium]
MDEAPEGPGGCEDAIGGAPAVTAPSRPRAQWRRRQIIDAATSVMEREGFHRTSMAAVAEAAGISVGLIYQYVENKEDLLQLVLLDVLEDFRAALPAATEGVEDPIERLDRVFDAYCTVIDRRYRALVLAYRETRTLAPQGRKLVMDAERGKLVPFVTAIEDAAARGTMEVEDPTLLAYTLVMSAHAWALKHWFLSERASLDEYRRHQLGLVLRATLTPAAREHYRYLL